MQTETTEELRARLNATIPMYAEAKRIHARLMTAGDDGSWAGETDLVKVVMYATAILAAELRGAIVAEREACAKIAEEWWNSPDGAVVDIDLDQFPVPAAIRART
jgi:hypothetical protein